MCSRALLCKCVIYLNVYACGLFLCVSFNAGFVIPLDVQIVKQRHSRTEADATFALFSKSQNMIMQLFEGSEKLYTASGGLGLMFASSEGDSYVPHSTFCEALMSLLPYNTAAALRFISIPLSVHAFQARVQLIQDVNSKLFQSSVVLPATLHCVPPHSPNNLG